MLREAYFVSLFGQLVEVFLDADRLSALEWCKVPVSSPDWVIHCKKAKKRQNYVLRCVRAPARRGRERLSVADSHPRRGAGRMQKPKQTANPDVGLSWTPANLSPFMELFHVRQNAVLLHGCFIWDKICDDLNKSWNPQITPRWQVYCLIFF